MLRSMLTDAQIWAQIEADLETWGNRPTVYREFTLPFLGILNCP